MKNFFNVIAAGINHVVDTIEATSAVTANTVLKAAPAVLGLTQDILTGIKTSDLGAAIQRFNSLGKKSAKTIELDEQIITAYEPVAELLTELEKEFDRLSKPQNKKRPVSIVN